MKRLGITLIELLGVIAIVVVIAAIALPVLSRAKMSAKRTLTLSNLRQLVMAQMLYANDNDDEFALARGVENNWQMQIEPYSSFQFRAPDVQSFGTMYEHSGYVMNDCLRFGSRSDSDSGRVVLMTESVEFMINGDTPVLVQTASKPDINVFDDLRFSYPTAEKVGHFRSTYYFGKCAYVMLDGSARVLQPNQTYRSFHDCLTEENDLPAQFPLHYKQ